MPLKLALQEALPCPFPRRRQITCSVSGRPTRRCTPRCTPPIPQRRERAGRRFLRPRGGHLGDACQQRRQPGWHPVHDQRPGQHDGRVRRLLDRIERRDVRGMSALGGATAYGFSAPSSTSTLLAPGTSYSANKTVVVFAPAGTTLPTGLTAGTIYWTKSVSGDSFQLSATNGGSAISLSADGSGSFRPSPQKPSAEPAHTRSQRPLSTSVTSTLR